MNAGLNVQKYFKYSCVIFLFCFFFVVVVCGGVFFFFSLLQVLNEKKLQEVDSLWKEFETPEKANKM